MELKRTGFSTDDLSMAKNILSYLAKNPEAKDTIHGIAQWWLLNEKIDHTLYSILNALNLLISKDLVREFDLHGDCIYYQINKEKLKNIVDLLGEKSMTRVTTKVNQKQSVHITNRRE